MSSRDIGMLVPPLQILFHEFRMGMDDSGLPFIVTCTTRSKDEQVALYAQGREDIAIVNELRKVCNLSPLTYKQNKEITWTLRSKHFPIDRNDILGQVHPDWVGMGLAFDIAIVKDGKPTWDIKVDVNKDEIPDYIEAANVGESVGLICGAKFFKPAKPDYPHFQLKV